MNVWRSQLKSDSWNVPQNIEHNPNPRLHFPTSSELFSNKAKTGLIRNQQNHLLLRIRDASVVTNFRLFTSDFSLLSKCFTLYLLKVSHSSRNFASWNIVVSRRDCKCPRNTVNKNRKLARMANSKV